MITEYGMSERLGPITYEKDSDTVFLGRDYGKSKNFSEQIATEIDKEVRGIIHECYEKAKEVIETNIGLLKTISHYLLEVETLTKEDIDEIVETNKLSRWDNVLAGELNQETKPEEPVKTSQEENTEL
jgi:cell division protease FtsH